MKGLIIPNDRKFSLQRLHPYENLIGIHIRTDKETVSKLEGLFMRTPQLQILEVEATRDVECMDGMLNCAGPDDHACKHISEVLFSSILSGQRKRLRLHVLNFKRFDFKQATCPVVAAVAFECLRTLILQDCQNVSALLNDASRSVGPKLNHLLITSARRIEQGRPAASTNKAVEAFLQAATGLQSLAIDAAIDPALEPSIEAFAKPCLKLLMLRCTPLPYSYPNLARIEPEVRHRYWAVHELRKLVQRCPALSELAIHFPPIPICFTLDVPHARDALEEHYPEYFAFLVSTLAAVPTSHGRR